MLPFHCSRLVVFLFFVKRNKILALEGRAQVLIKEAKKTKTYRTFNVIDNKLKSKAKQFFFQIFCLDLQDFLHV